MRRRPGIGGLQNAAAARVRPALSFSIILRVFVNLAFTMGRYLLMCFFG